MASSDESVTEQQVIASYRGMRSEIKQLAEKMAELEVEMSEHQRVMDTLTPMEDSRKAYRMVGGILVERTVKEVLPAVTNNKQGIEQVMRQLESKLREKEKSAAEFQVTYSL